MATKQKFDRDAASRAKMRAEFDSIVGRARTFRREFTPGQPMLDIRIRVAGTLHGVHASTWRGFVRHGWVTKIGLLKPNVELWRVERRARGMA